MLGPSYAVDGRPGASAVVIGMRDGNESCPGASDWHPYIGTVWDCNVAAQDWDGGHKPTWLKACALIDLLPSLVVDTVLFPIDGVVCLCR